jgi:hypothetical protein
MERYTDTISGEELYVKVGKARKVYKFYYKDKNKTIRHRIDGPAIEYADGSKAWYVNGKLHRTDGPAIAYADGDKVWWVDGVFIMHLNKNGQIINRME